MIKKNGKFLTVIERNQILRKKERKKSLRNALASNLGVPIGSMELGYVTMTAQGFVVHVIHYCFKYELKEFCIHHRNKNDYDNKKVHSFEHQHIAALFTKKLYLISENVVNNVFNKHFNFEDNIFIIK